MITFDTLPEAVDGLIHRFDRLEQLLLNQERQMATQEDQLLTIQQAATFLSLATPTIYGLVSRSAIPHSKRGKRLYFSKQELLDWVQSGRKKTTDEIAAEAKVYCIPKNKRR